MYPQINLRKSSYLSSRTLKNLLLRWKQQRKLEGSRNDQCKGFESFIQNWKERQREACSRVKGAVVRRVRRRNCVNRWQEWLWEIDVAPYHGRISDAGKWRNPCEW